MINVRMKCGAIKLMKYETSARAKKRMSVFLARGISFVKNIIVLEFLRIVWAVLNSILPGVCCVVFHLQ